MATRSILYRVNFHYTYTYNNNFIKPIKDLKQFTTNHKYASIGVGIFLLYSIYSERYFEQKANPSNVVPARYTRLIKAMFVKVKQTKT